MLPPPPMLPLPVSSAQLPPPLPLPPLSTPSIPAQAPLPPCPAPPPVAVSTGAIYSGSMLPAPQFVGIPGYGPSINTLPQTITGTQPTYHFNAAPIPFNGMQPNQLMLGSMMVNHMGPAPSAQQPKKRYERRRSSSPRRRHRSKSYSPRYSKRSGSTSPRNSRRSGKRRRNRSPQTKRRSSPDASKVKTEKEATGANTLTSDEKLYQPPTPPHNQEGNKTPVYEVQYDDATPKTPEYDNETGNIKVDEQKKEIKKPEEVHTQPSKEKTPSVSTNIISLKKVNETTTSSAKELDVKSLTDILREQALKSMKRRTPDNIPNVTPLLDRSITTDTTMLQNPFAHVDTNQFVSDTDDLDMEFIHGHDDILISEGEENDLLQGDDDEGHLSPPTIMMTIKNKSKKKKDLEKELKKEEKKKLKRQLKQAKRIKKIAIKTKTKAVEEEVNVRKAEKKEVSNWQRQFIGSMFDKKQPKLQNPSCDDARDKSRSSTPDYHDLTDIKTPEKCGEFDFNDSPMLEKKAISNKPLIINSKPANKTSMGVVHNKNITAVRAIKGIQDHIRSTNKNDVLTHRTKVSNPPDRTIPYNPFLSSASKPPQSAPNPFLVTAESNRASTTTTNNNSKPQSSRIRVIKSNRKDPPQHVKPDFRPKITPNPDPKFLWSTDDNDRRTINPLDVDHHLPGEEEEEEDDDDDLQKELDLLNEVLDKSNSSTDPPPAMFSKPSRLSISIDEEEEELLLADILSSDDFKL